MTSRSALEISVLVQPRSGAGSTYVPSIRADMCTPGVPCGVPALPTGSPRRIRCPVDTQTSDRYDTEILYPGTGSIVTVFIPATEPAKVTVPETGASITSPIPAA